jgi:hypothetical protein
MITALFSPLVSVAHAVTISMSIPGASTTASSTPGAWVANFYQFALMIGGVLAFGVVVYGGVKYMASAGNPSGQSDAKEWIEAALLGLLLLVGAYFILNVVNPQLTNLGLPPLQTVNIQSTVNTATTTACGSYGSTGNEVTGNCANSANGSVNNCCSLDHGITWACQATSCSTNPTYTCLGSTKGNCQPGYTCTNEGWAGGLLSDDWMCVQNSQ